MPTQDTSKLKEKMISIFRNRGPSLPVHLAKETGLSILFASVFLSELLAEKKLKISHLRVGSSPVYFIPDQETKLENFAMHLKSKEKEAFILIKEKKILKDEEQEPAIKVALREIKDFAIPFEKEDKLFWRYFIVPEPELPTLQKEEPKEIEKTIEETEPIIESKKDLDIFEKEENSKPVKKKASRNKAASQKKNEKFFNKIKEFLSKKSIEISDILGFSKNDLILKIKSKGEEKLLFAYNKKRITETDLVKANKKASELDIKYGVLSLGETSKKLNELLEAAKNLSSIEKVE